MSQVSWVRSGAKEEDLYILTAGNYTYTSDHRVRAIHPQQSEDWTLEIRETQLNDSGMYECQVSTETKLSLSVFLHIVGEFRTRDHSCFCLRCGARCAIVGASFR
jgi:hypothetical protein